MANVGKKDREIIEDILGHTKICMMVTMKNNRQIARPMYIQEAKFDGDIWFFADERSDKAKEIEKHSSVNLSFVNEKKNSYLSMSGKAKIIKDEAKMKELWNPMNKAWFKDGLETPGISLIKFTADSAEYWDSPDSKVVELLAIAKAVITKSEVEGDKNKTVSL